MNIENINLVIEALSSESVAKFDLAATASRKPCGTVACIGGTAALLAVDGDFGYKLNVFDDYNDRRFKYFEIRDRNGDPVSVLKVGAEFMGLDEEEAKLLFIPRFCTYGLDVSYSDVTVDHAVKVTEHLKNTGKVDWSVAFK